MKDTLEGISSRLDEAEYQISNLEDKVEKRHLIRTAKRKNNVKKLG